MIGTPTNNKAAQEAVKKATMGKMKTVSDNVKNINNKVAMTMNIRNKVKNSRIKRNKII